MNTNKVLKNQKVSKDQQGTTTIIALLIMMLLLGFVAFAITRSANETIAVSNEISETKTLFAAQASIENMALKTDAVFENKLALTPADVTSIESLVPDNYTEFSFAQNIIRTKDAEIIDATGEQFQGLKAIRDEWQLTTTATNKASDVKVTLRRRFFNNRIPIFQFGTFYDGDMNFYNPAPFNFGGRVHSNANIYIQSNTGLYFASKVTAVGQILTDISPSGTAVAYNSNYIKDGSGTFQQLRANEGSALASGSGANLLAGYPLRPAAYRNSSWETIKARFNNNLLSDQKKLNLPLRPRYIDLIKPGKNIGDKYKNEAGNVVTVTEATKDGLIPLKERYYNKSGIRISLADSQDRLPGCATTTVNCGIRLDNGTGYLPVQMFGGIQSTRFNAGRFRIPDGRQIWIKIELVAKNDDNPPTTTEITADILSLGLTERPDDTAKVSLGSNFQISTSEYNTNADRYSIVKMQRFIIPGSAIGTNNNYLNKFTQSSVSYNFVLAQEAVPAPASSVRLTANLNPNVYTATGNRFACHNTQNSSVTTACTTTTGYDHADNQKTATVATITGRKVAPFPIMMFDSREGMAFDSTSAPTPTYPAGTTSVALRIPWAGVMSAIDVDIANLKLFLDGNATLLNLLPRAGTPFSVAKGRALRNTDVPTNAGWVLFISDRRGDKDFDGEYDMEDILPSGSSASTLNNGVMTAGEDSNNNGIFENDYDEAPRYSEYVSADVAASTNTRFYRRVVRLVNGQSLPGYYDAAVPANTKGLTISTENAVYVMGNYNSTGISSTSTGTPTPYSDYLPSPNDSRDVPAAIAADAITLLSNNWKDANSFSSPFSNAGRVPVETTFRFAALVGNSKDWAPCVSNQNQGGTAGGACQSGGVHNLLRYLEIWSNSLRSNYSGSLINLYNSANSNAAFKCCTTVYVPPSRNYVFDESFLDINRIPPGSPYLQSLTLTGFERVND